MKKLLSLSCFLIVLLVSTHNGFSQTTSWKGTTNAFWNNAANWTNGIPDITKDVIVGDANFTGINQPKVNVASTCKSITVGGVRATTLTLTRALTMAGNLTINPNGTVIHPAGVSNIAGNFTNNGIYSAIATASTMTFTGTNQTIGGTSPIVFRRLTIKVSSTVTLASDIKVDSTSSILAVYGVLDPVSYKVTSTGPTRLYDTAKLKVNTADFTSNYVFTGVVTLYAGSIVEYASTTVDQVVSSVYSYSTLMISGSGTKSLAANLPNLYGKLVGPAYGKIIVNGGTFDLGIFTANRAATKVGGELRVANGATLKIGGLNNFPINFATKTFGVSGTVEYNGADQTISPQAYGSLLFSAAGIKTATTAFSTAGNFTITNGTLNTNAIFVTHSVAGDFTVTGGAITGTNYTITMNGTADQAMNLNTSLLKLNINNTGGVVNMGSDLTVTNTLNFTKGNIKTNAFDVIIPSTASVTGAGQTTGWVNGNLQKNVATGPAIFRSFEIGETDYTPVMLFFASVSIAGELTASTRAVDHSEINYSGVDPSKDVNRYWAFNNAGILFTSATATFNWIAADVDGGATTSNFKTGTFNGTGWSLLSVTSQLPTSIQASGLTSLGDFCVGESITKSTWTGDAMTSDWFTPKNWLGLIPSTTNPTLIPDGITGGRVYPVLTGSTGVVKDLTVESAATLTVSSALQIAGTLASNLNITATAGTIEFNGNGAQTIAANSFAGNTIKNLVVTNDVAMADVNIITGTVTVANGKTLVTNDNLVLKSDANGTARVAALPIDGSGNATAYITGNVSIERYIPARKAWRLLSAPIQSSSNTTIDGAWQEGAYGASSFSPNPNPNPGYGVHIVGGTVANGFDQSPTNSPTLKVYNAANNSFVGFPASPGTFTTITSYTGYMIYIRGDRGIDLSQGNNAATTATTLRMRGAINTGKQTSTVNPTHFTVLGNPYPSAIDFATITRNNVKNSFYVWDPKLAGTNGLGAYVTVSWNSGTNSYDVTTSASGVNQYIPSGEAILVESLDGVNPGTIVIKETDKTANGSDQMFGRNAVAGQQLRINLYAQDANGASSLLDGSLTTYNAANSNQLDNNDIKKLTAEGENISLQREGNLLAIERRKTINENDISFLNITNMKQQQYKLEIIAEQLSQPGLTAILKDKFSVQLNNTSLNTNGNTEILFTVTDDPASYAADRFSIVFSKEVNSLFSFKSVKASLQQKNVAVEWQTENEFDVNSYDIEGSADGIKFTKLSALASKRNTGGGYSWFDLNATPGDHYYRIKSNTAGTERTYSSTVRVNIPGTIVSNGLNVYPNPVRSNATLLLSYLEKGMYVIEITTISGQLVKRHSLVHIGGTFRYSLPIDSNLPSGKYQVKLTDGANINFVTLMIKE